MTMILHPTDLSPDGQHAFEHALRAALVTRGDLEILHVSGKKEADWRDFPHVRETLQRWGILTPEFSLADLNRKFGIKIRKSQSEGSDVVHALNSFIDSHDIDLVVLSTQTRNILTALISPSVASRIATRISKPILCFRAGQGGFLDERGRLDKLDVLLPVDNDPDPQLAIDYLPELQKLFGAPVTRAIALHCGDRDLDFPLAEPKLDKCRFEQLLQPGKPAEEIVAAAHDGKADLIVMVSKGPTDFRETLFGSTARQVIDQAPCPVLLLPAPSYNKQAPI